MATYQRKTLRTLTPLAREVAEAINECDAVKRRLTRLLGHMLPTELASQAFRHHFPSEAMVIESGSRQRFKQPRNKGQFSVEELDEDFHSSVPRHRRVLGE